MIYLIIVFCCLEAACALCLFLTVSLPHGDLEWYVVYDCGIPDHTHFSLMLFLVSFLLLKNIAEEKKLVAFL